MNATNVTSSASPESSSRTDKPPVRTNVPAILSIDETASVLTVSRRTVAELLAQGRLKAVRIGRRRVIARTAIEKFLGIALVS